MEGTTQACPGGEILRHYHAADLDDTRRIVVEEHLAHCPACQQSLQCMNDPATTMGEESTGIHRTLAYQSRPHRKSTRPEIPGYEILGELGRGGMGVVYEARHLQLNRQVALKMILAGGHAGEAELTRFRTEAEALARLNHPHIVQVFEVGEHEDRPYFSLEFCAGGSLARKISGTPLSPREAAQMVQVLARAVHAAHQKGIIHRDLKPANVLLTSLRREPEEFVPKITDFGLAKKLYDASGQTQSGDIIGTPSYMAPEQARGQTSIGPAADIYALGAILYELLTGRPPFKAATPFDTVMQVVKDEPAPPSHLQSKTPRDLEIICLKCLRKEPEKRYATAEALAEDLDRYLTGRPITARLVGWPTRVAKWVRRNPFQTAVLVLLSVSVVMLAAWRAETERAALKEQEANEATVRQLKAERDQQLAAVETAVTTAFRRGDPRGGLDILRQAEKDGLVITPSMRLGEADALEATGFAHLARQRLETFGKDFGPDFMASRDLRLGDLLLGIDDKRAETLIRGARDSGRLKPQEQAYAEGVLADNTADAIHQLRIAIGIDPYYLPARRVLGFCLVVSGRLDEAIRTSEDGLLLNPEHPDFLRIVFLAHGFKGDEEGTQLALKRMKPSLREELHPILEKMARDLPRLNREFHAAVYGDPSTIDPSKDPTLDLAQWKNALAHLGDTKTGGPEQEGQIIPGRFPPPCRRAMTFFWSFIQAPLHGLDPFTEISHDESKTAQLALEIKRNPEGFAMFSYAMVRLCKANDYQSRHPKDRDGHRAIMAEVGAEFEKASMFPGLLDVRQLAKESAIFCYAYAGRPSIPVNAVPREEWVRKAGDLTRARLKAGNDVHLTKIRVLVVAARNDGDYSTARRLLDSWEKRQPGEPKALKLRAEVEFRVGAYHPALEAAEKALEKMPKDAELLRIREECMKKIMR